MLYGTESMAHIYSGETAVDYTESLYGMLHNAGFVDMRIQPKDESKTFIRAWVPGTNIADYLISATIEAVKP